MAGSDVWICSYPLRIRCIRSIITHGMDTGIRFVEALVRATATTIHIEPDLLPKEVLHLYVATELRIEIEDATLEDLSGRVDVIEEF